MSEMKNPLLGEGKQGGGKKEGEGDADFRF